MTSLRIQFTRPMILASLLMMFPVASCHTIASGKGNKPVSLTEEQVRSLAKTIANEAGWRGSFSWVVFSTEVMNCTSPLRDEVIRLVGKKYRIYSTTKDLPENVIRRSKNGGFIEYRAGFIFDFKVEWEAWNVVKIHYEDYEGIKAASWYWKKYQWTGKEWKVIEYGPVECAMKENTPVWGTPHTRNG